MGAIRFLSFSFLPDGPSMTAILRRTLRRAFTRSGTGVHTGVTVAATVAPAPWGTGIVCCDAEHPRDRAPARIEHVVAAEGATVLQLGDRRLSTVEHLLAALYGAGITDAEVVVSGPEIPILDGSARPWADGVAGVGVLDGPEAAVLRVVRRVEVEAAGGRAVVEPADRCEVAVEVDFDGGPSGTAAVVLEGDRFAEEVAWARTFVLERDIERLRAEGRGKGASEDNTVVWPGSELRADDEPVRHKLLDAVGDLALLGRPLRGRVAIERPSHALHHALIRALLADGGVSL